ncbi:chorismate synthase [Alloiococcus sp. CFN-8]|uniref:chorismate synthase n=1 Tax=Alloiococcus sp. CFN-8 TaxID=3416081 RepID=UPI003CED4881
MSSTIGENIKITIFGESHGPSIGVVIDGLPPGEIIDMESLQIFLERRAPGRAAYSTPRKEADKPIFLSGLLNGKTTGTPLCAIINNTNIRSQDYNRDIPRPGHADYTGYVKYKGYNDAAGGGHFSGRLTAPLSIAGGICLQILERMGITIGAHIYSIERVKDTPFDPVNITKEELIGLVNKPFSVIDEAKGEEMKSAIFEAKKEMDSLGGVIECCILGAPIGLGDPMFHGIENRLSQMVFGIPAIKGIEFGSGFQGSEKRGSENNDPYIIKDKRITLESNNSGGILGGISTGMPIIFRAAVKPTPSIGKEQKSVSISENTPIPLNLHGRHDPCIVPRALPCIEAAAALVMLDMLLG